MSDLLHLIIVIKDGLGYIRYDDFNVDIDHTTISNFDGEKNTISFAMPLNFIWHVQNDIKSNTPLKEIRTKLAVGNISITPSNREFYYAQTKLKTSVF